MGRVRYDLYSESFVGAIFTDRQRADGHNRVAGTVFYAGYDDRLRRASHIDLDLNADGILERAWQSTSFRRENRAIFVKFQYLFRL